MMELKFLLPLVMIVCLLTGSEMKPDCPNFWVHYEGSCYLFGHDMKTNFVTAENYCQQHGGHLIHVGSYRENQFIKTYLEGLKPEKYWLGITDETGVWQYYGTSTDITYSDWDRENGEPESNKHEHCALYRSDKHYHWHNYHCMTDYVEPLCEMPVGGGLVVVG